MTRTLRGKNKGFTLIELMVVVAIVGVLAVLAIVGVRRYLSHSKSAEARNSLGALGKAAYAAMYIRERQATAGGARLCLQAPAIRF